MLPLKKKKKGGLKMSVTVKFFFFFLIYFIYLASTWQMEKLMLREGTDLP